MENGYLLSGRGAMLYSIGRSRGDVLARGRTSLARWEESDRVRQDAQALADLFEEYYNRIARYIAVRIGNRDEAEELAGDVFLRALERVDSFEWRGIPLHAWLFRIAHNLAVDHLRKHHKRRRDVLIAEVLTLSGPPDPQQEVEQRLELQAAYQAMDRLTPAQQEVISLRFIGELSSAEAADVMGRTNGAVRELQHTALRALRQLLRRDSAPFDEEQR